MFLGLVVLLLSGCGSAGEDRPSKAHSVSVGVESSDTAVELYSRASSDTLYEYRVTIPDTQLRRARETYQEAREQVENAARSYQKALDQTVSDTVLRQLEERYERTKEQARESYEELRVLYQSFSQSPDTATEEGKD